ncbi:MAG TPA: SDR family oxidoreductase [Rhodanobacteraceae bacterium]
MSGKVAVITGASRGIGARVAEMLAAEGGSVIVNYKKNADLAEQVLARLRKLGGDGVSVQADVEDPAQIAHIFDVAADKYGRLDYFVNNAAASAFKRLMDLQARHLDRSYAMNLRPFVLGAQEAVKLMDRGGRIVALTSYGADHAYPTYAALGPYKAAIESLIRYMAVEFAGYGINVNGVNGGLIESDSLHYFYEKVPGQVPMQNVLDKIPLHRPGSVDEMANTVMFLLGDKSSYITGQTLVVDGGLSVVSPPFWSDTTAPLSLPERPHR